MKIWCPESITWEAEVSSRNNEKKEENNGVNYCSHAVILKKEINIISTYRLGKWELIKVKML